MAHTIRKINVGNTAIAQVTFTSYTSSAGGEQFTLAEFGLTGSLVNVQFFAMIDPFNGNECNEKYTRYMGAGKVMLLNPATLLEQPTVASGLSWTINCIVTGS
jgi:hypothetical protein